MQSYELPYKQKQYLFKETRKATRLCVEITA